MKRKVILLVEDNELDVISVERSLRKLEMPYELHTAFNGIEALDILRRNPPDPLPDIILLDINMPRMNGLEFLEALRADARLKKIRVFVMTTSGEQYDRNAAENLGISGYLIKPMAYSSNYDQEGSMAGFVQFHLSRILRDDA